VYHVVEISVEVQMKRIRQLRQEQGLSQAKLAVMADMDPATLNRLEQGKGNPNLRTLERVAEALDVEVAELLGKARGALPSQERLFNGISEQQRRALNRIEEFCNQLEHALDTDDLDELIATTFRVRIIDIGELSPALYESEAIRPAMRPLATRFLELARQFVEKAEQAGARDTAETEASVMHLHKYLESREAS
jgi:transcriptional regulator with XRE-family HTH domain